jgi:hypothetical protein
MRHRCQRRHRDEGNWWSSLGAHLRYHQTIGAKIQFHQTASLALLISAERAKSKVRLPAAIDHSRA